MKLFGKELMFNGNKVYHVGNKPTASEIGAASTAIATISVNGLMSSTDKEKLNKLSVNNIVYISSVCTVSNGVISNQDSIIKTALNNNKIVDFEGYHVELSSVIEFENCLIRNMNMIREKNHTGQFKVINHANFEDCSFVTENTENILPFVTITSSHSVNFRKCNFKNANVLLDSDNSHFQLHFEYCTFSSSNGTNGLADDTLASVGLAFVQYMPTSDSLYLNRFTFVNCKTEAGKGVVALKNSYNTTISGNAFISNAISRDNNRLSMIYLQKCENTQIDNNTFRNYNCMAAVVKTAYCKTVSVSNNNAYYCDADNFYHSSSDISVTANSNTINNIIGGIYVTNGDVIQVIGNNIMKTVDRAINVKHTWHIIVNSNNITHCNTRNADWNAPVLIQQTNGVNFIGNYIHRDAVVDNKPILTIVECARPNIQNNYLMGHLDIGRNTEQILQNNLIGTGV